MNIIRSFVLACLGLVSSHLALASGEVPGTPATTSYSINCPSNGVPGGGTQATLTDITDRAGIAGHVCFTYAKDGYSFIGRYIPPGAAWTGGGTSGVHGSIEKECIGGCSNPYTQSNFNSPTPVPQSCPPNSTGSGSVCTCNDPMVASGGVCQMPNACSAEAGKLITTNYTMGWVKNPSYNPVDAPENMVGDYVGPKLDTYTCVAGCKRYLDSTKDGVQGYTSMQSGPNGLFRLSMDFVTVGQGTTCTTPPNSPSNPNTPSPPCPGTIGQVNGANVCLPKAGPNTPPLPTPSNPASAPPSGAPVTPGNPAAGDKPPIGQGSGSGGTGRSPTTGSGGNDGGGSSSTGGGSTGGSGTTGGGAAGGGATSAGGGGTGTATDPYRPKDPCGLPGTAKCKLDETGTGTGEGAYKDAITGFDNAAAAAQSAITGAGTKTTSLGWTWGFTLPPTVCTPFSWGKGAAYSVNPCTSPWILLFRQVMGYLFYALAAMYIWRSTTAAPAGAK